jgi:hypothetical protein
VPATPVGCPTAAGAVSVSTTGETGGTIVALRGRRVLGSKTERHRLEAAGGTDVTAVPGGTTTATWSLMPE